MGSRLTHRLTVFVTLVALASLVVLGLPAGAEEAWNPSFLRTWSRLDRPVAEVRVNRTWMWGPEAFTTGLLEPYAEASGGTRLVQYFDKSRMEITADPAIPMDSIWYVTNGLLAKELITGRMQTGNDQYEDRAPAQVNVAGDPTDPTGPTYASFSGLYWAPPTPVGQVITARLTRGGVLPDDPRLADYYVVAATRVTLAGIDHAIASPFWAFMQSSGMVYDDGGFATGPLFENPFYATGYPISEAYWTSVQLDGVYTDVLVQCFERRCLTYTPDNPDGWKVEAGNIGRHYYAWRYSDRDPVPAPVGSLPPVIVLDPGHESSSGGALGIEYLDTLRTALATRDALERDGYVVYLTRPDNATQLIADPALLPPNAAWMDPGYSQGYAHTSKALQFAPDLYLSLHYNAHGDPAVAGLTVYYCDYGGGQNAALAELVRQELVAALAERGYSPPSAQIAEDGSIGKVYGHLATLGNVYPEPWVFDHNRLAGVPAVLTEPLFETNPTEGALIAADATHQAFARAYLRAVNRYFGR